MIRFRLSFGVFLALAFTFSVNAEGAPPKDASALPGVTASLPTPADPTVPRGGMNQFIGLFQSVDSDRHVFHMIVDNYNIEMIFNSATKVMEKGQPLPLDDLAYGDKIVVRYLGRELLAAEVERIAHP